MPYTPDLIAELNTLLRFAPDDGQQGLKIHSNADPEVIAAAQRLFAKGLITLADGGFLTRQGREAAEHAHAAVKLLAMRGG
jgi:uncharacterized protein (TIGR02647 family)